MCWIIHDTGSQSAARNMEIDTALLQGLSPGDPPMLHFYDWERPAATFGHFINPADHLNLKGVEASSLDLARRPTGGGLLFHLTDFAFSLLVPSSHFYSPNTLENYAFVNELIIEVITAFLGEKKSPSLLPVDPTPLDLASQHFCYAKPTIYDVIVEGKKVAGGAQRKTKWGFLHQGSISVAAMDPQLLDRFLKPGTLVTKAMAKNSGTLLESPASESELIEARKTLKALFVKVVENGTKNYK